MVGSPDADVWNHAWGPWWFWESLKSGQLPWHNDWLFHPQGGTLWFIDPISGLLGALLVPLLGILGTFNAVIFLYLVAASWAAARLAESVAGPGRQNLLASVALLTGPYLLSEVHNGISEAVNVAPTLLALWAAERAFREGTQRNWTVLGLLLGLVALGSAYYLLATAVILAVCGVAWLASRPPRVEVLRAVRGGAIATLLVLPIGWLMRRSVHAGDALIFRASEEVATLKLHNAVDPRTYFWPGGFQSVDLTAQGEAFLHSGYLGLTVIALAVLGTWWTRRWALAIAATTSLLIGLGSHLFVAGEIVQLPSGATLALPHRLLELLLPPQAITHPLRLALPGIAIVSVLAAAGLKRLPPQFTLVGLGVVGLEMLFVGQSPWPMSMTDKLDTEAATYIADSLEDSEARGVLDLPGAVGNTMATSRYLVYQAYHRRPIPYRPDARASTSGLLGSSTFVPMVVASEWRVEHRGSLLLAAQNLSQVSPRELADRGIRWVVVHRSLDRGQENLVQTEAYLESLYGKPRIFGDKAVYSTLEVQADQVAVPDLSGSGPGLQP